jgi:hypothetical protein
MHLLLGSCRDVNNNHPHHHNSPAATSMRAGHTIRSDLPTLDDDSLSGDSPCSFADCAVTALLTEPYVPNRKKYSEPSLPGLLREELLARIVSPNHSSTSSPGSSLAPMAPTSGNDLASTVTPNSFSLPSSNLLSYLPFRRFSKRAQSDPWIADKILRSPCPSRRFTLGTDNFTFSSEVHSPAFSFVAVLLCLSSRSVKEDDLSLSLFVDTFHSNPEPLTSLQHRLGRASAFSRRSNAVKANRT